MKIVDRTAFAPPDVRVRTRRLEEVDLVCLHQTGTPPRDPRSPRLDLTAAHLLVLDDGEVRLLHPLLTRMRVGSRWWNSRCVTVEVRANLPTRYTSKGEPVWWRPDLAGTERIEEKVPQVRAVRELLKWLRGELPAIKYVGAHRQIEAAKPGCCGPDLFSECAMYAVQQYGYQVAPTDPRGLELLPTWTRAPRIPDTDPK